ncbi:hypothetical protein, partial [Sinorhizobium fredii]|uniref:hypothetical protein n=1 Tax=Rhizobium fredii TaxID=380 RepID=UPI001AEBCDB6
NGEFFNGIGANLPSPRNVLTVRFGSIVPVPVRRGWVASGRRQADRRMTCSGRVPDRQILAWR